MEPVSIGKVIRNAGNESIGYEVKRNYKGYTIKLTMNKEDANRVDPWNDTTGAKVDAYIKEKYGGSIQNLINNYNEIGQIAELSYAKGTGFKAKALPPNVETTASKVSESLTMFKDNYLANDRNKIIDRVQDPVNFKKYFIEDNKGNPFKLAIYLGELRIDDAIFPVKPGADPKAIITDLRRNYWEMKAQDEPVEYVRMAFVKEFCERLGNKGEKIVSKITTNPLTVEGMIKLLGKKGISSMTLLPGQRDFYDSLTEFVKGANNLIPKVFDKVPESY